jgi:hypothetical protein
MDNTNLILEMSLHLARALDSITILTQEIDLTPVRGFEPLPMTETATEIGTPAMTEKTTIIKTILATETMAVTPRRVTGMILAIDTKIETIRLLIETLTETNLGTDTLIKVRRRIRLTDPSPHPLTAQNRPLIMLKTGKAELLTKMTTVALEQTAPAPEKSITLCKMASIAAPPITQKQ